jgi:cytochrome c-type biogenesis protein CcmH/NrfF
MKDGEHEGVPGARIDQVYDNMDASKATKPTLYLVNAGTNDCQQNYKKMQGTIDRLNDLLTKAWRLSGRATIILSTLTPSFNGADKNERVNNLNKDIRACKCQNPDLTDEAANVCGESRLIRFHSGDKATR